MGGFQSACGYDLEELLQFYNANTTTIGRDTAQMRCLFTMDNLIAYNNPLILKLIYAWGYHICFRAPYYPVYGTIENVFNTLQHDLSISLHAIKHGDDLYSEMMVPIAAMPHFVNIFLILDIN